MRALVSVATRQGRGKSAPRKLLEPLIGKRMNNRNIVTPSRRGIGIAGALSLTLLLAAGAAGAQTAQERADDYIQQTVIDPMNAQRTLLGLPVITLEEYKANLAAGRKQAADAMQAAIDKKAAADKANPEVQEVNRWSGDCGGWKDINYTMVPVHGKCEPAYKTIDIDPRTNKPACNVYSTPGTAPRVLSRIPGSVGLVCRLIGDNEARR